MQPLDHTSSVFETARQASRGKLNDLQCTTAGFTLQTLDGYGLRYLMLTRPASTPTYPISVRRLAPLLHASSRPHLTVTPLRFANLHLHQVGRRTSTSQVIKYARHTTENTPYTNRGYFFILKDSCITRKLSLQIFTSSVLIITFLSPHHAFSGCSNPNVSLDVH